MHAFLCAPGFEAALMAEIGPDAKKLTAGVVISPQEKIALSSLDYAFARQVLPDAKAVKDNSISKLALGALEIAAPIMELLNGQWALHVMVPDDPSDRRKLTGEESRANLIAERFLAELKERKRKLHKKRDKEPPSPVLVQLLLVSQNHLLVSVCAPLLLPSGATWPTQVRAGRVVVENDWDAPSSAYRKLEEALAWLEQPLSSGHRCVDLGASPGGWTHVILKRNAFVVAVDRAELDPRLMGDKRVKFMKGDAFKFVPGKPVDWLFCDLIADPEKSAQLLLHWVRERWCKGFVYHLKFKGRDKYGVVQDTLQQLRAMIGPQVRAKHLLYDKNEVTFFSPRKDG